MHTYKVKYSKDGEMFTEIVIAFSEDDAKNTVKRDHPGVTIEEVAIIDAKL